MGAGNPWLWEFCAGVLWMGVEVLAYFFVFQIFIDFFSSISCLHLVVPGFV